MFRIVPFMLVGAIFLVAAIMKAISPHGLVGFLEFVGLSPEMARVAVLLIVAGEAAIGVALLVDPRWPGLRWLTIGLACVFLLVPMVRWLVPEAPGCGCFGTWATHAGLAHPLWEFGRGTLLLGLLLLGVSARSDPGESVSAVQGA